MATQSRASSNFSQKERDYASVVVQVVSQIVDGLARALFPRTEVVLHDLTRLPHTIVAIAEPITGRGVGGPPTDLGLRTFSNNPTEDIIGYPTVIEGGPQMRSSTLFFRAPSGRTVVALCMNADVTQIRQLTGLLDGFSSTSDHFSPASSTRETFPSSVDSLAYGILNDAILAEGISVELMKKAHKVRIVAELEQRGFFAIRESVDLVAKTLGVSRYTIYNYLNELHPDARGALDSDSETDRREPVASVECMLPTTDAPT